MKLSASIIISFTILATGCTLHTKKIDVIVGSGTFYTKWRDDVLTNCNNESAKTTLEIVDENIRQGVILTERDVDDIHRYLVEKCSREGGIVI